MIEHRIICFTDLGGYTTLELTLGHSCTQELVSEHLEIGENLIRLNQGEYIKSIGDAHMAAFSDYERALGFATELQQYYKIHDKIKVRITFSIGVVDKINGDFFGPAVIEASRQEIITEPIEITVSEEFYNNVIKIWSFDKCKNYFELYGEFDLKGIGLKSLYRFDWIKYSLDFPQNSLAGRIFSHMKNSSLQLSRLNVNNLTPPGVIIWPVVPRNIATAIHRGQIEIIKLLCLLGWELHILVANCRSEEQPGHPEVNFLNKIVTHLKYRNISKKTHSYLSDYFTQKSAKENEDCSILHWFILLSSKLTMDDLIIFNQKEYSGEMKQQVMKKSTLDFIRPILTCAATLLEIGKYASNDKRVIVIAGEDEAKQWRYVLENNSTVGIVFNPILKESTEAIAFQSESKPTWYSELELQNDISKGNIGKWIYNLFFLLPNLYKTPVNVFCEENICEPWSNEFEPPGSLKIEKLVEQVWPFLDTTRPITK